MPVSYRVDGGAVIVTFTGTSAFDEVQRLLSLAASDPRLVPDMPVLIDARTCRDNVPEPVIRDQARFVASLRGRLGPRYAVVTDDSLRFGLARMFEAFGELEGLDVAVFKRIEDAREWLASRPARSRPKPVAPTGASARREQFP